MRSNDIGDELKPESTLTYTPECGKVLINGKDALAFLDRMSTNKTALLSKEHPLATTFTNNKGHIIDHCLLYEIETDQVLLVSSQKNASTVLDWLSQFHFVEDFTLTEDKKHHFSWVICVDYPSIEKKLSPPHLKYWWTSFHGKTIDFFAVLDDDPKDKKIMDFAAWETLRIKAMLPQSPHEISQKWMPQNVGLKGFIADNKGCYTGQEVISKALHYQKNVKTLCGLKLSREEFHHVRPGAMVEDRNGEAGHITSLAPTYWADEINALVIAGLRKEDVHLFYCSGSFLPG